MNDWIGTLVISYFGGSNNIFADYMYNTLSVDCMFIVYPLTCRRTMYKRRNEPKNN